MSVLSLRGFKFLTQWWAAHWGVTKSNVLTTQPHYLILSKLLVALDLPRYAQYLETISLTLALALLYVVINISGDPVSVGGLLSYCSLQTMFDSFHVCIISLWRLWGTFVYRLVTSRVHKCTLGSVTQFIYTVKSNGWSPLCYDLERGTKEQLKWLAICQIFLVGLPLPKNITSSR